MAVGDVTISGIGVFTISGADILSAVNGINITAGEWGSGARLYFVPFGNSQCCVFKTVMEG